MLIKCLYNESFKVQNWKKYNTVPLEEVLEVNKYYTVYGIIFGLNDGLHYEILTEHDRYTKDYPASLFEIIDNRLSSFFVIGNSITGNGDVVPFISFREWVMDNNYFEKLVDGDVQANLIFTKYKELLYLEYRHPDVKQIVLHIQDKWVQCPVCTEAWELEYPRFEMCQCPKCGTVSLTGTN